MGKFESNVVSIVGTAHTLPDKSITNREIGELLISGVRIDDEAAAEIVALGTHEELMENSAIYAEIYHSQLVGDAEVDEAELATNMQEAQKPL